MPLIVEKLSSTQRLLRVTLPWPEVKKSYDARVRKSMRSASLPGFRKGHIPQNVVESHYGRQIMDEVLSQCVSASLREAQADNQMRIVGEPQVSIGQSRQGEDITCDVTVDVYPELEARPLESISLEVVKSSIAAADIETMINRLRDERAHWQVNDQLSAGPGHLVYLDYEVLRDNGQEPQPEGSMKNQEFPLVIGYNSPYPGFDQHIQGHRAGEQLRFSLQIAADYAAPDIAGHELDFEVTIKSVSEKILPEVDEQFIRALGIADGSLDSLHKELEVNLSRTMISELHRVNFKHMVDALLELYGDFEVPQSLVDEEKKLLMDFVVRRAAQLGAPRKLLPSELLDDQARARIEELAVRRARFFVILFNFLRDQHFQGPTQEQINEECRLQASAYENAAAAADEIRRDRVLYLGAVNTATEKLFLNFVLERASTTEVTKNFYELFSTDHEPAL